MEIQFEIELTPKQQEVYNLFHQREVMEIVMLFSRQSGKTILAELLMIESALAKPKQHIFYISPSYSQGRKIFGEICSYLEKTNVIKKRNGTTLTITFFNGSYIQCFTTQSPTAIRGNTCVGLLVLDECAFMQEVTTSGEYLFDNVIYPITKARSPKILFISTPNGKQGKFYEKYLQAVSGETRRTRYVKSTIYDDKFITQEEIERLRKETPPLAFQQEFEVEFLDNAITALSGFEYVFGKYEAPKNTEAVWMGIDLSSVGEDETIITVINESKNIRQYKIDGDLDRKYDTIAKIINSYTKLQACYIEINGIGSPIYNEIRKRVNQKGKLHEWLTTNNSKNDIVSLLQTDISNKEIHIPDEEKELYVQMGVFRYTVTKSKKITYGAKDGYHDDRVMSLCIALKAKDDYKGLNYKKDVNFVKARFKEFS